ncbi:MAG: four helix bundle protein, partial [Burkholderiales bacterium]
IRRAAISVEANVVEGYALGTPALYVRHLRIAMGSAAEAECLTRLAGELGYLPESVVRQLEKVFGDTMRALHGLLRQPNQVTPRPQVPTSPRL